METNRLELRFFRQSDAPGAHELFCDEQAMRLVGMYPPYTQLEQSRDRVRRWADSERRLAIVHKETGEFLGYVAVNPDSEEGRADTRELGFALIERYRGRGFMKEALGAVLRDLAQKGVVFVWACCFKGNAASENLIHSLGFEFQQEGSYDAPNDRRYESLEFRIILPRAEQ